ncbi:hypothetical protein [Spirosoma arcticum]
MGISRHFLAGIGFLDNLLLSGHPAGTSWTAGEVVQSHNRFTSFLFFVGRAVRMMLAAGFMRECIES